jgi:hypothetical protein
MRHSPINDGYIIKEEEYEEIQSLLRKLRDRLLATDSVGDAIVSEVMEILQVTKN